MNTTIPIRTYVRVYRNLTKQCLSVQVKVNGQWKVVAHTNQVCLQEAEFKVSAAGNKRVREERKKYVHAYVYGHVISAGDFALSTDDRLLIDVTYNPYLYETFVTEQEHDKINYARYVAIEPSKIKAYSVDLLG